MVRPPFSSLFRFGLLLLRLPLLLPFYKLPLALLALVESENVRHDTAGNRFNLVLGNAWLLISFFLLPKCYLPLAYSIFKVQSRVTAAGL